MSNAIVTLICVAALIAGVALIAQSSFKSMDMLSDAWQQMEVRTGDIARTGIEVVDVDDGSSQMDITLYNSGQVPLRNFSMWDVVIQYYQSTGTYNQRWLSYTTSQPPGDNRWTVVGIYRNSGASQAEVFQPGIFDPDEYMLVRLRVYPASTTSIDKQVIIGTPNGVTVSTNF